MQHQQSYSQTDPALERYMAGRESADRGVPLEAPMFAPDDLIGSGLLKGLLGGAALMSGIKSVGKKAAREAPQSEALRLAQQRAALPVENGGLGLPANNTPQMRADAQGWDLPFRHNSPDDITAIDPAKLQRSDAGYMGKGLYGQDMMGNSYSNHATGTSYPLITQSDGMRVHDMTNWNALDNPYSVIAERFGQSGDTAFKRKVAADYAQEMMNNGYHGIVDRATPDGSLAQSVVFNPDNIRSRFAAFDPWRRNSAIAAAMGVAAPDLLAAEQRRPMSDLITPRTD